MIIVSTSQSCGQDLVTYALKKFLHINVHNIIFDKSQQGETTQWMGKQTNNINIYIWYYLVIQSNEILIHAYDMDEPWQYILSEISQTQMVKYYMTPLI